PQKSKIIFEIIVAHGPKANRFFAVCLRLLPQLNADQIEDRGEHEHDPGHQEFTHRRVHKDPDDYDDRECGNDFHSRKMEWLAIGTNSALTQHQARGPEEEIN